MHQKPLSQEGLKLIACLSMFLDHFGAVFVRGYGLRIIGRLAFPIYCYLLAEGSVYTRNPRKYGIRLLIGVLLSEIPYDLLFSGEFTWAEQSVMVTLLLGFLALQLMKTTDSLVRKLCYAAPFVLIAELCHTDYGGGGVLLIVFFALIRGMPREELLRFVGMGIIFYLMNSFRIPLFGLRIPIEMFALGAAVPLALYSGKKDFSYPWLQWAFYLFYPGHILALWLVRFSMIGR